LIIGTLTLVGQQEIRKYIADYATHSFYIAYGLCAITDTALETDTGLVHQYGNRILAEVSASDNELTLTASKVAGSGHEVLEVGIFTAPTEGLMIYRGLLSEDSTLPKTRWLNAGDTLEITIILNLANGVFV
jgi:hypothetical protein